MGERAGLQRQSRGPRLAGQLARASWPVNFFLKPLSPKRRRFGGEVLFFFFLGWYWTGGGGKASKWADFFIFFWAGKWERAVGLFPLNVFFFFVFVFIFL